jgi:hypothetical protein
MWAIIDGLILISLGLWLFLAGFGVVSMGHDKKKNEEVRQRWGVVLKVGGLFLVIVGAASISGGVGLLSKS